MSQTTTEISSPVAKTVAAWGSVGVAEGVSRVAHSMGIHNWGDAAQFAAFALSACYLTEFIIKRAAIPLLCRFGFLKRHTRTKHHRKAAE